MTDKYTLRMTFTKHPNDSFNGILINKVALSVKSQPDPRDDQVKKLTTDDIAKRQAAYANAPLKSSQIPWDRTWLDDNNVEIDHYFDTEQLAIDWYHWWKEGHVWDDDKGRYTVAYALLDPNNNPITLT